MPDLFGVIAGGHPRRRRASQAPAADAGGGQDRDAFLAPAGRHDISDIVHLAGSIPDEDPVAFFRTETSGLLNALDAARTWGVRRFAVAGSLGVYIGRTETRWHEDLALPTTNLPHLIIAFKKAVEPLATHSRRGVRRSSRRDGRRAEESLPRLPSPPRTPRCSRSPCRDRRRCGS